MSTEENKGPRRVKFHRIVPQLKSFNRGTLLKNKVDLFYSLEEDIVETGGEDNFSPLVVTMGSGNSGGGTHTSFPNTGDFISKDSITLFAEAAQFRADDGHIYVRLQLLAGEKVVWVNLLRVQNRVWSFLIRSEQKARIKEEIEKMFEICQQGNLP